jgi:hypothetical protein
MRSSSAEKAKPYCCYAAKLAALVKGAFIVQGSAFSCSFAAWSDSFIA